MQPRLTQSQTTMDNSDTVALVAAGGPDDTAPEESDGMVRKAPQFGVMQPAATKQFYESPENIEAADAAALCFFGDALRDGRYCFSNDADDGPCQRHIDASALFARFATLSTLSTAIAEEHGNVNRLIRTGSHSKLDELEAPTLDATGLRHMLRGVGLGVPNSMSVRPMLAEYGEVVGCRPRLTYAQFETLYAALKAYSNVPAVAKIQSAWRKWRMRRMWPRALFVRFATQSTADLNRRNRSGSHPMLDELEVPTLDATGLRHVLRGVGLGVPNSTSVRPMIAEFGEVVGCQPRLTYAQFETLRAALNDCGDGAAAAVVAKRRALVEAKVRAVRKATIAYEQRGWFECMTVCNEV